MIARFAFCLAIVLLAAALPSTSGAEEPSLAGRWRVAYVDKILGLVDGTARVAADEQSATLTLIHPQTGLSYQLRSSSVKRTGNHVNFVFEGHWTGATGYRLPPLGDPVGSVGASLKINLGKHSAELPIRTSQAADEDRVTIDLDFGDADHLAGTWTYRANADGGRDHTGNGALGDFEFAGDESGTATETGSEFWYRTKPDIRVTVPVVDQLDAPYGSVAWPYPYLKGGGITNQADARRVLLVVGTDLPEIHGDHAVLESLDPRIKYFVRALKSDFAKNPLAREEADAGWKKLKEALSEQDFSEAQKLEVMLVEARLAPGILPGKTGFTLNGAEGTWLLQFGDFSATFEIVRPIGPAKFEPASLVFRPERIAVQLRATRDLPYARIPVLVGLNGAVQRLGTTRAIIAYRDVNEPRVYRTELIALVDSRHPSSESEFVLKVELGDTITAQLGQIGLVDLRPRQAQARVLATPADAASIVLKTPGAKGLIWKEALTIAAQCASQPVRDWDSLTNEQADTFTNVMIFTTKEHILETPISLGDHAAMLMLRQAFVELMGAQEKEIAGLAASDDDAVMAWHEEFRPFAFRDDVALTRVKVTDPNGIGVGLSRTYLPDLIKDSYGLEGKAADRWIAKMTRDALAQYLEATRHSKKKAEEVKDCDVERLLGITGFGFDAVIEALATRLMRLEEIGTPPRLEWRPEPLARRRVARLHLLAEKVRAQKDLAKNDTQIGLVVLTMATAPLALVLAPVTVAQVALALTVADSAITLGYEIPPLYTNRAEVKFARGAAAVLGIGRLDEAERRENEQWAAATAALLGSSLAIGHGYVGWLTALEEEEIKRGIALIRAELSAEANAAERLPTFPRTARHDVLAAMEEARFLERQIGREALEEGERAALKFSNELEETWALSKGTKPVWAKGLNDRTFSRIEEMRLRPDVARLVEENPQAMAAIINDDDGLRLLFSDPYRTIGELQEALSKLKKQRQPVGSGVFKSGSPDLGEPEGLDVFDLPGEFVEPGQYQARVYAGSDNNHVAIFKTAREATEKPGKLMLVLDTAKIEPTLPESMKKGVLVPGEALIPETGRTPLGLYMNLRAMNALGFKYADPRLVRVQLKTILNAETCIQLDWLQRAYPGYDLNRLARYTDLLRYTESVLKLSGFRITGVKVGRISGVRTLAETGLSLPVPAGRIVRGSWFSGGDPAAFLARYGLVDTDFVPNAFDIYIDVVPMR